MSHLNISIQISLTLETSLRFFVAVLIPSNQLAGQYSKFETEHFLFCSKYRLTYLLTYLLHGAESFLKS